MTSAKYVSPSTPEEWKTHAKMLEARKRHWRLKDGLAKFAKYQTSCTLNSKTSWEKWCAKATAVDKVIVRRAFKELEVLIPAYEVL